MRNAKRRQEFIKGKTETASNKEPSNSDKDMDSSQEVYCDKCGRNFKTDQGLNIHVGKAYKSEDELENGKDKFLELYLPAEDRDDRTNHLANSTLNYDEEEN